MGGQQHQLPRKPSNVSSSFANWGSLESAGRSSFSSIGQLLRVCWHSQSLFGMAVPVFMTKTTWWHCQGCIKTHRLRTAITGVHLHHTNPAQSKMHHLWSAASCSSPSAMSPIWEAFQDYQNENFLLQKQFLPQSSPDYATSTLNYHTVIFWLTQCKLTIISSIWASKTFYIVIGNLTST